MMAPNIIATAKQGRDGGALRLEGARALLLDEAILLLADGGGFLGPEGHGSSSRAVR